MHHHVCVVISNIIRKFEEEILGNGKVMENVIVKFHDKTMHKKGKKYGTCDFDLKHLASQCPKCHMQRVTQKRTITAKLGSGG